MKRVIYIVALISIMMTFFSCGSDEKIILIGTLGEFESRISLRQEDNELTGTFKYTDNSTSIKSINLNGLRAGNNLRLEEFSNGESKLTGIFNGEFDDNMFVGYWTDPTGSSKVPFSFIKSELQSESSSEHALVESKTTKTSANGKIEIPALYGLTYDEARELIIGEGWYPVKQRWQDALGSSGVGNYGNGKIFWDRGYAEVQSCSGTGKAFCSFLFTDPWGRLLRVVTAGEQDYENEYNAIVQSVVIVDIE
tara:strand:- start:383 stop:1138 length:756 start_codon:yes stop_codon:yes gene_type:complete